MKQELTSNIYTSPIIEFAMHILGGTENEFFAVVYGKDIISSMPSYYKCKNKALEEALEMQSNFKHQTSVFRIFTERDNTDPDDYSVIYYEKIK